MIRFLVFAIIAFTVSAATAEYKFGDQVVVIKDGAALNDDGKVVDTAGLGVVLRVNVVKDDWLWVRWENPGWMKTDSVVPLAEAVARLDDMIAQRPNDAVLYKARGIVKYSKADYASALEDLTHAINLSPNNSLFLGQRASIREALGDRENARVDIDEAIRLDPKNVTALVTRGVFLLKSNDLDNAVADFNSALGINFKYVDAYYCRSMAYSAQGDYTKAIEDLDAAISLDPTDPGFYITRGNCFLETKQYDKAQANYSEAIRVAPSDSVAYIHRALTFSLLQDNQRAKQDLSTAVDLAPTDVQTLILFGAFLTRCADTKYRDLDKAIECYAKVCELSQWMDEVANRTLADTYVARGHRNRAAKDFVKAHADFSEAIRLAPSNREAYLARGTLAAWDMDAFEEAQQDLVKALELIPSQDKFRFIKANYLSIYASFLARCPDAKYRNGEKAFELATNACELSGWKKWNAIDALASAYAECSDFANAIKYEEHAIDLAPETSKAKLRANLELFRQGKPLRK